MRKWLPCKAMVIAMLLTGNNAYTQTLQLKQHSYLPHYASASALAWFKGALYVMGDDAPTLLVLNKKLKEQRQPRVFPYTEKRIPYAQKPDMESATVISEGRNKTLWFFPSFSTPLRNKVVRLDVGLGDATPSVLTLSPFNTGIARPNIEGAEYIGGKLFLANRATREAPTHYLLVYDLQKQILPHTPDRQLRVKLPPTNDVVGISGMHYMRKADILLLTVSTERMATTTTDGIIGASYLAVVKHAGKQLNNGGDIEADTLLPLAPVLKQKEPMKIESVTVSRQGKRRSTLVLAADNDNGTSHLFVVSFKHLR